MAAQVQDVELTLQLGQDDDKLHDAAKDVLQRLLPEWSEFDKSDIKVSKISGGITNVLLKLSPPEGSDLAAVALRVFGDRTEDLIDRQRELRVLLQLNAAGFGAPVVGTFGNGRVETFIPYRPLTEDEMAQPKLSADIARRLAQLHAVNVEGQDEGEVFGLTRQWLRDAKDLKFKTDEQKQRFQQFDLAEMDAEVRSVEEACSGLQSPIVCSHNDLLCGNILVPVDEEALDAAGLPQQAMQFIDFEYCSHMHRGFDWGNHFNEYAGLEADYSKYPDKQQTAHFLHAYLTESTCTTPSEEDVDAAAVEAHAFALASHQFWGTWALYQVADWLHAPNNSASECLRMFWCDEQSKLHAM